MAPPTHEKDRPSQNSLLEVLADATVLLALVTALLYFLGVQKQKTMLQELGYTKPILYQSTEETLITGFGVLVSIGDDGNTGFNGTRYIIRGIMISLLVLAINRLDLLSQRKSSRVWIFALLVVWSMSWESARQGKAEAARKKNDNPKKYTVVYYTENSVMRHVRGHSTFLADGMLILTPEPDSTQASAVYIPTTNIQRIEPETNIERKAPDRSGKPTEEEDVSCFQLLGQEYPEASRCLITLSLYILTMLLWALGDWSVHNLGLRERNWVKRLIAILTGRTTMSSNSRSKASASKMPTDPAS